MKIKWYGHACFEFESSTGVTVITDPFDEKVGYELPKVEADIVTVSHSHYDHNNTGIVIGDFKLIDTVGEYSVKGIKIEGFNTFHDDEMGAKRGSNIVFIYNIDGLKVCHFGDLGHILNTEQLKKVQNIDILLIPVGGTYTIDSKQAVELVKMISPKITIPMHYKTNKLSFKVDTVNDFIREFNNVVDLKSNEIDISSIPTNEKRIFVFAI